jgi:potassium-transporting ATPase KdpC subunit
MKNIFSQITLTFLCLVLFSVLYPLAVTGIAQFATNNGKGEIIKVNGNIVGFQKVGQSFTCDNYFWGRPSAVNYNSAGSGGSNKGPSNPDYLKEVQLRIDTFLVHHPYLQKKNIPAEMVTASGSGLDPNISSESALIQVKRISINRNISESKLINFVNGFIQRPFLGLFGTSTVNVLQLNVALDNLK